MLKINRQLMRHSRETTRGGNGLSQRTSPDVHFLGRNAEVLIKGMREMGIETLLRDHQKGPIIQTFLTPRDPNFHFETFYEMLRQRGYAIYPGKVTKRPSFSSHVAM